MIAMDGDYNFFVFRSSFADGNFIMILKSVFWGALHKFPGLNRTVSLHDEQNIFMFMVIFISALIGILNCAVNPKKHN